MELKLRAACYQETFEQTTSSEGLGFGLALEVESIGLGALGPGLWSFGVSV